MKVKSLQIGRGNEPKTTVTYRKLGKHAYIVNEAILIVFTKGKENTYHPAWYKLSSIEKEDFNADFLNNLKNAFEVAHTSSLEDKTPES